MGERTAISKVSESRGLARGNRQNIGCLTRHRYPIDYAQKDPLCRRGGFSHHKGALRRRIHESFTVTYERNCRDFTIASGCGCLGLLNLVFQVHQSIWLGRTILLHTLNYAPLLPTVRAGCIRNILTLSQSLHSDCMAIDSSVDCVGDLLPRKGIREKCCKGYNSLRFHRCSL